MTQVTFWSEVDPRKRYQGQISPERNRLVVQGQAEAFRGKTLVIDGPGERLRRRVVSTDGRSILYLRQATQQGGWI